MCDKDSIISDKEIDEMMATYDAAEKAASIPDWDRYRGDHHNEIPDPGIFKRGYVDFREHLDKPLGQKLWIDIVFRLRGFRLRVYDVGGYRWTDCWDNCTVWVDGNNIVRDIRYSPPSPYRRTKNTRRFERSA